MDIASYADVSTPLKAENNTENVIASSEQSSDTRLNWCRSNCLKSNVDSCRLLVSTNKLLGIKNWRLHNR